MDTGEIKYIIFTLAILGVYWIWEWKKEHIPEIIRKIVYWVCYLGALYIFFFAYEDWFIRFLAVLFLPFMSCLVIFGRRKRWDSFKDFLKQYYESDGLWLLSLIVIGLQLVMM